VTANKPQFTVLHEQVQSITAASANSTTSLADIPGVSFSVPITNKNYNNQFVEVCYYASATKATSTTGTIGVYANGAEITASERSITSAAGISTMASCYVVARSSAAAQTVKLQFKSGDTAAFTINNGQVRYRMLYVLN
jgi:hypothetical protein